MMGTMIEPDVVLGLGGFGDTVSDALHEPLITGKLPTF